MRILRFTSDLSSQNIPDPLKQTLRSLSIHHCKRYIPWIKHTFKVGIRPTSTSIF